jgi:hypothetical protein
VPLVPVYSGSQAGDWEPDEKSYLLSFPSCTWERIFSPSLAWAILPLKWQEDSFTNFGKEI